MEKQEIPTIPSYTHVSEDDPNARRKRVPTESELFGLRGVAKSLAISMENVKEDIKRAQGAHEALLAKYQHQLRELEGTQSQLHGSKRIVQLLQGQCSGLEVEAKKVAGIIHPVRRCPPEVLQCIFEAACDTLVQKEAFVTAIQISHVCQRWRSIALNTPQLWSNIDYTMNAEESNIAYFWNNIIPRMKSRPVHIQIREPSTGIRLNECHLKDIPSIEKLTIHLPERECFKELLHLPEFLPQAGLTELGISLEERPSGPIEEEIWDLGILSDHLPSLPKITLIAWCPLCVTPCRNLRAITHLLLVNVIDVDILHILPLFTQIQNLELMDVDFFEPLTIQPVSSPLKILTIVECYGDHSWLTQLTCNNITGFYYDEEDFSPACETFIQAHRSIMVLEYHGDDGALPKLANTAPQISNLTLGLSVKAFSNWLANGMTSPPFEFLTHLKLLADNYPLSLTDFESVVMTRCLPHNRSQSRITAPLRPLESLSILRRPTESGQIDEPWRSSDFYKSAVKTVARDSYWEDLEAVILTWP